MKRGILGTYTTVIDIGTTKICVLIAHVDINGNVEIVGIGKHPSHGLSKGVVVNIAQTVNSIQLAVKEAEGMSGIKVEMATVGISGGHIKSFNSTGVVAIKKNDVSQHDIDRVIEAAKAIPISQDQDILHVLPQYFRVDGQEYVLDAHGMYGVRLEAKVHIITGAIASAQNIIKSCELAHVYVNDIVLEQLASAEAVLTPAERDMGVGIIDIGGGTSDFAIYKNSRIRHSKVLPFAGNHFTNDLKIGLTIPEKNAEEIKKLFGSVTNNYWDDFDENTLDVDLGYQGGVATINLNDVAEILHFRADEIFELFSDEINEYHLKPFMPAGIVLTGGGSMLAGIDEVAKEKLSMQVRIGSPIKPTLPDADYALPDMLKSPIYSTAYGLLLYTLKKQEHELYGNKKGAPLARVMQRMKSWLYDFL